MQSNLIVAAVLGGSCLLLSALSHAEQSATFVARNSALEQRASDSIQAQKLAKSGEPAAKAQAASRQAETPHDS